MPVESWSFEALVFRHDDGMTVDLAVTPALRDWLRNNGYPQPCECRPAKRCGEYRPACLLGICKLAVQVAGDW